MNVYRSINKYSFWYIIFSIESTIQLAKSFAKGKGANGCKDVSVEVWSIFSWSPNKESMPFDVKGIHEENDV